MTSSEEYTLHLGFSGKLEGKVPLQAHALDIFLLMHQIMLIKLVIIAWGDMVWR